MTQSRRKFLAHTTAGLVSAAAAGKALAELAPDPPVTPVAGTPPAFGTAPAVGPEITVATVAEAQKLARVEITAADQAQLAGSWRENDGVDHGAAHRAAQARARDDALARDALEPDDPRRRARSRARPVRPEQGGAGAPAEERRGHRVRARDVAFATGSSRAR